MEICEGESVILSATSDYALVWEPGEITANEISVSPSTTTTYTVTASNNCGDAFEEVVVEVNELPSQPEITVDGSDLVSSQATDYQWHLNGQPISGANGMAYSPIATGDYSVEITDENGCTSVSENYSWIAVGVGELDFRMDVYPVPFSTNLKIKSNKVIQSIQVVDFTGRAILEKQVDLHVISIETAAWTNGVYFLKMKLNDQQIIRRIIKSD